MKKVLIFIILSTLISAIFTTSSLAQNSPKKYAKEFFAEYDKNGIESAIDTLYSTNKWMTKNQDAIENLKKQMIQELDTGSIGEYHGQELLLNKKLTDNYRILRYVVRFGRQPIKFTFQFYKPNKEWKIYSFRYSFGLANELEKASTLELLDIEEE